MGTARWLRAVVVTVALVGCSTPGMSPSASVTTIMQGWERYFRLDWEPLSKPNGIEISGYVNNSYGSPAGNMQILAQSLDPSGNVLGQQLAWVHGTVPPFGRSYFIVPGLPLGAQYRASVWAYDIIDEPGFPRRRW